MDVEQAGAGPGNKRQHERPTRHQGQWTSDQRDKRQISMGPRKQGRLRETKGTPRKTSQTRRRTWDRTRDTTRGTEQTMKTHERDTRDTGQDKTKARQGTRTGTKV